MEPASRSRCVFRNERLCCIEGAAKGVKNGQTSQSQVGEVVGCIHTGSGGDALESSAGGGPAFRRRARKAGFVGGRAVLWNSGRK